MAKVKKDSVAGQVQTVQTVSSVLKPTLDLTDREQYHYDLVIKSREASSWMPVHITTACLLAKTLRRLEETSEILDSEGVQILSEKGNPMQNPLLDASHKMSMLVQSYMKTLGLTATGLGLATLHQERNNKADLEARKIIEKAQHDALLA